MRKIIKPNYYHKFQCTAGDCEFTCCQQWKIAVDDAAGKRWDMADKGLNRHVGKTRDGREILLKEDGFCPFLEEDHLCSLVKTYGEEFLSHTCHTFPREQHEYANRTEYAFSSGCPQALHLLWEQERFEVNRKENREAAREGFPREQEPLFWMRDFFLQLVQEESRTVPQALKLLFFLMLDLFEKGEEGLTDEALVRGYMDRKLLAQVEAAISEVEIAEEDSFYECNELLLDLAENYRRKKMYEEDLEPIAKRAECYEGQIPSADRREQFEEIWSGYEGRLRLLMAEEIYASSLLPEGDSYSMTMKLQWLAMEYAVIRQWNFLHWDMRGEITDASFTRSVAVLFRMMGYSEADIEEYLDNSFASIIWEWGYFALIVGR
ncbi:MAG: flagellin lysine-N-methylase [Lachnospiraceae bacterium]|nr:flagellin lysine-N-methylase [Lachnospiraceae bacterium]